MSPKFQTYFGERVAPGLDCSGDEILVKQSEADSCDVNKILEKYARTGILPETREAIWGQDFGDVPSFMEAMERVRMADEAFLALPAELRLECGNDPVKFVEKLQDDDWAFRHGLRERPPSEEPSVPPKAGKAPGQGAGGKAPAGAKASTTPDTE